MDKKILRKNNIIKRNALTQAEVEKFSNSICNRIIQSSVYKDAEIILFYSSYNNEVCLNSLFSKALNDNKRVAYPKSYIIDNISLMDFYYIDDLRDLVTGYKGILEPDISKAKIKKVESENCLCIVPGLAFDYKLMRTGYGKGFYDNYLNKHKKIYKIGVCYDFQLVESIDSYNTDIPMDMIITENQIISGERI